MLLSQSRDEIDERDPSSYRPLVGGQAVLEGVMMRNGDMYGVAVRRQDSSIVACRRPWITFFPAALTKIPCIRGFPVLVETLYNGVGALNRSAVMMGEVEGQEISRWQLVVSMIVAAILAMLLFVVAPHLLSFGMFWLQISGDVEGISFHLWDGFYKVLIFFGYLWSISLVPDIRRVFCFHGAEHKTIHAFEKEREVSAATTMTMSRFHPRCGTTFLLFVVTLSIIIHAVCVPFFISFFLSISEISKHIITILIKILLIIPISALSYEIIKGAAKLKTGLLAYILQTPGLFLQRLTTREPNQEQVEVALVALHVVLDTEDQKCVKYVPYTTISE